jgi:predicted dinucleotide-binding enzyme
MTSLTGDLMNITLLGAGNVGRALGLAWARAGHAVTFGVRDPSDARHAALTAHAGVRLVSVQDAATGAQVVVLATPYAQAAAALKAARPNDGTIVVDATNALKPDYSGLTIADGDSAGEQVQRLVPTARVVKAFNTVGFNVMANPSFGDRRALLYVAGNDAKAKQVVLELARELGFEALDFGDITQSRLLESWALVWIRSAYALGLGRDIAFSLLRR